MYLDWKITDVLPDITVNEFNHDYNGIYGFIKLCVNDDSIGFIPTDNSDLEGNADILYWIKKTIECGISMVNNKKFECQLLSNNQLKICVRCEKVVHIILRDISGNILWEHEENYESMHNEIKRNFQKLKRIIFETNQSLLSANEIDKVLSLFGTYEKLYLDCQNECN